MAILKILPKNWKSVFKENYCIYGIFKCVQRGTIGYPINNEAEISRNEASWYDSTIPVKRDL